MNKIEYRSELITRPDGSQYVNCIRINDEPVTMTVEQLQISAWLTEAGTTE